MARQPVTGRFRWKNRQISLPAELVRQFGVATDEDGIKALFGDPPQVLFALFGDPPQAILVWPGTHGEAAYRFSDSDS